MFIHLRDDSSRWSWSLVMAILLVIPAVPVASAAAEEKPDFPKFEEVTKDMAVKEGLITLYFDKKTDKLLARIPATMLNQKVLWATSIAAGPNYAGFQWNSGAVYFERIDKKLVLMGADPRYKKGSDSPVSDAISRTYTDEIIKAVPIVTMSNGDPVIDVADLMKTDMVGVGMLYGGSVDQGLSRFNIINNYPENTNISVDAAVMNPGGAGQIVGVYYSISKLPEDNGYQPREADPRIGYFLTAAKDWNAPHGADTIFTRYINRWQLRKALPDKEVCDVRPEDQIVFYIEKTVPVQFRRHVREGILEWNKAFEAAGLRNVVVVHQQTETQHADKNPEDVRYNFFRWIVSGNPFAMGPSRVNPFTGEILDADIIMDDSYVRFYGKEYELLGPVAPAAYTDAPLEEFLAHHPHWDHDRGSASRPEPAPDPRIIFEQTQRMTWGHQCETPRCEIGAGAAGNLALCALIAAHGGRGPVPDEYIGQAIKETVMHEVGHTLGLRHKFKASSWLPLEQIVDPEADPDDPLTASVMDYNPYNFAETTEKQGRFATPTLGPYDYWAIEYGYRHHTPPAGGKEGPANEQELLKKIASRGAESGLAYATDEDASSLYPDPLTNRWDNGKDPLDFARERTATAHRLWKDGLDWSIKEGDSYSGTRDAFGMLMGQYAFGARMAARVVGGQYLNRDHKGDPQGRPPIVIIPAETQREALRFLMDEVLSCKHFTFGPEMLNHLAAGRWMHWASDDADNDLDYDVHNRVQAVQNMVLFQLLNPFTVNRIYDAECKVPLSEDAFGVTELFEVISASAWSELETARESAESDTAKTTRDSAESYTARRPMISSFRRSLQRQHLQRLIDLVLSDSGGTVHPDISAVARMTLQRLGERIEKTLAQSGSRADPYSEAHLVDAGERIGRALDAAYVAGDSPSRSGGGVVIFLHEGGTPSGEHPGF